MELNHKESNKENLRIIRHFLDGAEKSHDELGFCIIATVTQFLLDLRIKLLEHENGWLPGDQLLKIQVTVLRQCVVDLEKAICLLEKGATIQ